MWIETQLECVPHAAISEKYLQSASRHSAINISVIKATTSCAGVLLRFLRCPCRQQVVESCYVSAEKVVSLRCTKGLTFGLEMAFGMKISVCPLCRQTAERMRIHTALTVNILLSMAPYGKVFLVSHASESFVSTRLGNSSRGGQTH